MSSPRKRSDIQKANAESERLRQQLILEHYRSGVLNGMSAEIVRRHDELRLKALAVVREALDNQEVHPCDEHDDEVRGSKLYGPMRELYEVLRSAGGPPAAEGSDWTAQTR